MKCCGLQGKIRRKGLVLLMMMASLMVSTNCTDIINSIQDMQAGFFVMFLSNSPVMDAVLHRKPVSTGNSVRFFP